MTTSEADPEQLWESIRRSPLFGIYVSELYWLSANVVRIAEEVFAGTPARPDDAVDYLVIDPELHGRIYAVLGEAAKIRALIQDRPRRRNQSVIAYGVQKARTRDLRGLLDGIDLSGTLSADARHSLEHFDERLDGCAIALADGTAPLPMNVPFNITTSRRQGLLVLRGTNAPLPKLLPLRVYIAEERVFINAGEEVNVGKIYDESRAVVERLGPALPLEEEGRGGLVLVITETSFEEQ